MAKKMLSVLLILCILCGLIPNTTWAAEIGPLYLNQGIIDDDTKWAEFKDAVRNATAEDTVTIEVSGEVALSEPLTNSKGASFIIKGDGPDNTSIQPDATSKSFDGKTYLFTFYDGDFATPSSVVVQDITFDGTNNTPLLSITGAESATLHNCRFQNGSASTSSRGSVALNSVHTGVIRNCTFSNNKGAASLVNTGCLYINCRRNATSESGSVEVINSHFLNNFGHSGGAMYVFGQQTFVHIDNACTFTGNQAGQRGGAIHCHGTVFVDGATFTDNKSDGLGGAFYVSAQDVPLDDDSQSVAHNYGVLILNGGTEGMSVTGSTAGTAGGAAYVNSNGTLVLMGKLNIWDNKVDGNDNNIFTAGTSGHIVPTQTFLDLTDGRNWRVGISTGSPRRNQDVVRQGDGSFVLTLS